MRHRKALSIAIAAVLGALAIAALPALAGAKDDHGHHRGDHRNGERHHHHGFRDRHENVGRISAFDAASGQLTIARFGDSGSISGLVTSSTEIKCEGPDDRFDDSARRSRDSGSSGSGSSGSGDDNSGPGSGDDNGGRGELEPGDDHGEAVVPGDDNGGRGEEEPGDDRGGDNSGPGRGGDDNDDRMCTTAELTVGTVVHEFDRDIVNGVVTFDEIELGHTH